MAETISRDLCFPKSIWRLGCRLRTLRVIRGIVNETPEALSPELSKLYSRMGRPPLPPRRLLRALLVRAFYSIRSERQLVERIDFDLLFRWFVGLGIDDPVWDATSFTHNRDRLLAGRGRARFPAAGPAPPQGGP